MNSTWAMRIFPNQSVALLGFAKAVSKKTRKANDLNHWCQKSEALDTIK